ncbi:ABC transporter ATP-binding protein [Pseudarthrobacter sp. N5]|uniref:ABC transporter ATP-binding protein n=1 Tax=Pseudarthrobacter sp. N5 TaxID=3418416 RepID=UPI003CF7A6D1
MSMDRVAWSSLYNITRASSGSKPFSKALLKRVFGFARPHRGKLVSFVLLSIAMAVLAVATPVLAGQVVDAIIAGVGTDVVIRLAFLIAAVAVAEAGLGLVTRWLSSTIGEGVIVDLRTRVFDHVQKMPIAFFTRTRTGALVSRLNNDVIGAQSAFAGTLSGVVSNVVALALTLVVMLGKSWLVTVLAMILLPIFLIPARRMGSKLADLRREAAEHNAAMGTQMTERFSAPGATLVKLFGRPDEESREFAVRAGRVRDIGIRTAMLQFTFVTALTLVSALALALVYGLGGWLAISGQLAAGDVVVLALLLTRLYAPLTALSNARVEIMSALVSFERVFEILDLKPLIQQKPDAVAVPPGPVSVEFDDVRFAYPSADKVSLASLEDVSTLDTRGGEEVLHGISFRVEPGQTVALVGSSGAGKSTIAQLLSRLYDVDSGAVRLGSPAPGSSVPAGPDAATGVDVRDVTFDSMRATLGMVTQDGHLFHESIASNLRLARPEATEEEMWDVLRQARLEYMIRSLPDGLDTVVGERGYRLSGGERQRLTIARLLIAQPRVVILDEATAALDSTNEAAVQAALGAALEGRTAVVIAHRLSTIRAADVILVIEEGTIVERGTHTELLAREGRYAELYRTQFAEASSVAEGAVPEV